MNGAASWEVGEVLSKAWDLTKSNIGLLIGVTIVMSLVIGVAYGIFYGIGMGLMMALSDSSLGPLLGMVFMLLGAVAALFASSYFVMNYLRLLFKIVRGQGAAFGDVFAGTTGMFSALIAMILVGLCVEIGMMILVVPGVLAAIAFFFTFYLIADKNMGAIGAMKESLNMVKGRWVEMLIWMLVVGGVNFVGALACGLGQLVTGPMTAIGSIIIFDRLAGGGGAAPGMPAAGGGMPPQGGGMPPQGGGYPPQGGGYPPQGGGMPPQGGGYPPQGGGMPPQGGGMPPQGGGMPPQGGGMPPQGGGMPPQGGGMPPQGGGMPPQGGGFGGGQGY